MLYNKEFLLLHYPKTAGKSTAVYFCQNFEKPIHGVVSPGQISEIGMGPDDDVHLEVGGSHDNWSSATKFLAEKGIDIRSFKALILPVRNPYDLYVSNYYFLRQSYERNKAMRSKENFALAYKTDFPEFCQRMEMANFAGFMPREDDPGQIQIELIRFENLADDLSSLLKKYGISESHPLPHLNSSQRDRNYAEMYDEASKKKVDEAMDAMFKLGRYPKRLS